MLRAMLTGTIATAGTEQAVPHGLANTPDLMAVSKRTTAAGLAPSVEAGDTGNINGVDNTNCYVYCESANTLFSILAMVWQGRSY